MKDKEKEFIKKLIEENSIELIIEHKNSYVSENFDNLQVTDNIDYLSDKKKKIYFLPLGMFHVNQIPRLNEGDFVAISDWKQGSRSYDGIVEYCHGETLDNDFIFMYWSVGSSVSKNVFYESNNDLYPIDVLVTASSRPQLIPYCVESFKRGLFTRRKLNWILHEDYVFPKQSEQVVSWAKDHFDEIYQHNPAIGLGKTMDMMLRRVKSKYIFYLQEDWYLERPVDLDQIIWTMDQHPEINCVILFKNKISPVSGCPCNQYMFSGLSLCLYHAWNFLPGIWRMDKVLNKWKFGAWKERPEGQFTNTFGGHEERIKERYAYNNMGAYLYGIPGDPRYVRHLGNNWRMARWRLENGKPGGSIESYQTAEVNRAPWVPWFDAPIYDGGKL